MIDILSYKLGQKAGGGSGGGDVPATIAIDYSNFDNGSFTETLETGDTLTYSVEFNTAGQPNKITAPDGTVTWIEWGES